MTYRDKKFRKCKTPQQAIVLSNIYTELDVARKMQDSEQRTILLNEIHRRAHEFLFYLDDYVNLFE